MLLDTSGLLCLHYPAEPFHMEARSFYRQAVKLVTHSYVLSEYVALAHARRFSRSSVLAFASDLINTPTVETIWVDESLHRAALDLLLVRQDKGYSLCDAVSFEIMRRRRITDALTTDRHFEQEGFARLLQPK